LSTILALAFSGLLKCWSLLFNHLCGFLFCLDWLSWSCLDVSSDSS